MHSGCSSSFFGLTANFDHHIRAFAVDRLFYYILIGCGGVVASLETGILQLSVYI